MAPRIENDEHFGIEEEQLIDVNVVQVSWTGMVIAHNAVDTQYSNLLHDAIINMPILSNYIGCINCGLPIAMQRDVINVIPNARHPYLVAAYSIPRFAMFTVYVRIVTNSIIIWHNAVRCLNCGILLTVPALTVFNQMIDEYTSNFDCIILDASTITVYRIEPL